jgi:AcrR family transcriptional regulator
MGRTRAALLAGAVVAIEKHGLRRMTMADVAAAAGVAKATLYNHFRAKPDVVAAVAEAEARALAEACAAVAERDGLAAALGCAAEAVSGHPAVRRVAEEEPAVLLALLAPSGPARTLGEELTARVAAAAGVRLDEAGRELVRRWVVSHAVDPADPRAAQAAARLVASAVAASAGVPPADAPSTDVAT